MSSDVKLKFEHAPQEKIRFVNAVADVFLAEVLDSEGALVTDESRLWDFVSIFDYDIEDVLRPGSKPSHFVFKKKKILRGGKQPLDLEQINERLAAIPDEKIEAEPRYFRRDVIQKTLDIFGVDISTVFDLYLPDVFHHIATHMPEEARACGPPLKRRTESDSRSGGIRSRLYESPHL